MLEMRNKILFLISIICLISCTTESDQTVKTIIIERSNFSDFKKYEEYITSSENGLSPSKSFSGIKYSIQYAPNQYVAIRSIDLDSINPAEFEKKCIEMEAIEQYVFTMELEESKEDILNYKLESKQEYESRINYLAFGFQNNIYLVAGKDTLNCELYHFERTYGLSSKCTLMLGFKNIQNNDKNFKCDRQIIINDNVFKGGIIKLKINKDDLKNIPVITIK